MKCRKPVFLLFVLPSCPLPDRFVFAKLKVDHLEGA